MAQLDPAAFGAIVSASKLATEYAVDVDPQSAKEMLAGRMAQAQTQAAAAQVQAQAQAAAAKTQAQIEKQYAHQAAASQRAYEKAQADAARAEARDEARAQRSSRSRGGYSGSSGGGFDLGQAAKIGAKVIGSPAANTLLRGIFGTLTGSPARRTRRRR